MVRGETKELKWIVWMSTQRAGNSWVVYYNPKVTEIFAYRLKKRYVYNSEKQCVSL